MVGGYRISATCAACVCALYAIGWSMGARADWTLATEAAVRRDDNIANAQKSPDIVADDSAAATLSLSRFIPLDGGYGVSLGGHVGGELFDRFRGLSSAEVGATAGLRKKWGLGGQAPWMRLGLQAARSEFDDEYRTGWSYRAGLSAGRRFGDRWSAWAGYVVDRRTATAQSGEVPGVSGDVYRLRGASLSADAEFAWRENVYWRMGIFGRSGDIVSITHANYRLFAASEAIAEDDVFGDDTYAYKIHGQTYGFDIGMQFTLTTHSLLGLEIRRSHTHGEGGNDYAKSVLQANWDCEF